VRLRRFGAGAVLINRDTLLPIGGLSFALEGMHQSVPRAELAALTEALRRTVGRCSAVLDAHCVLRGATRQHHAHHQDLWRAYKDAVLQRGGPVDLHYVPSHREDLVATALPADGYLANLLADKLAESAALRARVCQRQREELAARDSLVSKVHHRLIEVGMAVTMDDEGRHVNVDCQQCQPADGDQPTKAEMKKEASLRAAHARGHNLHGLGKGMFRCLACGPTCRPAKLRAFAGKCVPVGSSPPVGVHDSHMRASHCHRVLLKVRGMDQAVQGLTWPAAGRLRFQASGRSAGVGPYWPRPSTTSFFVGVA